MKNNLHILIDGRPFTASSAGISTFLEGSVAAWARECPHDTFIIALPKPVHDTFSREGFPQNVTLAEHSNWLFRQLPNLVWLLIMMPILARKYKTDIYYSPLPCLPFLLPRRIKKILVVHDVVNIEYQKTMQWTNILANKLLFFRSVKKADFIWTNSLYTKSKVELYFPKRKCMDIYTGCAVDRNIYRPILLSDEEKTEILQKYNINPPFMLFVGSLEPRKNLSFLLSLMPELYQRQHLQLVVVGGKGWKSSSIRDIVETSGYPTQSTVFCGFVPNEDLAKLYNLASCFVSASLNEGFGMPQLEALLCGCPIVTAHNSAMIEIAQGKNGATTIEGYDIQQWIDTILQVANTRPAVNPLQLVYYDWNVILKDFITHRL